MIVQTYGLVLAEHEFEVPLDHADPEGRDKPLLVYLQGGPGFEAPRPTRHPTNPGWLDRALRDYRVLMLDQRGTGRSTPVSARSLAGLTPEQQAAYLQHFRADAIVRDCETVREALGSERWSVLGQSFGGFCVLTYLSIAPEGLREAFVTGGLPPVGVPTDEIYTATFARQLERNDRYYARYPGDRARVRALLERLEAEDLRLPTGDRLTPRAFRQAGHGFGMTDGAEALHYLVELDPDSPAFRHDAVDLMGFVRNPIYAILHEPCYADGCATRWSADRVMPQRFHDEPELFTGEHVFSWTFEDFGELAPLREAADLLAQREWPRLYDPDVLAANEVPAAAVIYTDDPYVERTFSEQTAALVRGLRPWVTSEYGHNGLRVDGERILGRLIDLARGRA